MRECLKNEEITITHHPDFQRQALGIKYAVDEKVIKILSKKELKKKENLGESPTYVDLAMMLVHRWKTTEGGLAQKLFEQQLAEKPVRFSTRAYRERMRLIQGRMGE